MSDGHRRIEVITGAARRRRWTAGEKLRIVDETLRSRESISIVARRHGVTHRGPPPVPWTRRQDREHGAWDSR
ncbi:transposase [Amaricoccus solimangrovi]|uniref:Transposase n=1 Tax=Amaricoccus solimangrovi TaxID=2589815 RepID=A0A501WRQ6_9RHOB|nr:transposase [Amaricoccus solimangrovi]